MGSVGVVDLSKDFSEFQIDTFHKISRLNIQGWKMTPSSIFNEEKWSSGQYSSSDRRRHIVEMTSWILLYYDKSLF